MTKRKPTPTPPTPPNIRGGGDRYEALLAVLEHEATQAERSRAFEEAERRRRLKRGTLPASAAMVVALIAAWIWLFPPGFLRIDPPPPQPIEQEDAVLRFTMYIQAQRIRAYHLETGRLPLTLEEAGPPLPAMDYIRLSPELYQLSGSTDRITLTYRSDLPLDEFVGPGAGVVEARRFP